MSRLGSKNDKMMKYVHNLPGNFHGRNDEFCRQVAIAATQKSVAAPVPLATFSQKGFVGQPVTREEANVSA
jgi:hypothetical protein